MLIILISTMLAAQIASIRRDATPPENPAIRAEAVKLMERAMHLSSPVWPANEMTVTFRVSNPEPGEAGTGDLLLSTAAPGTNRSESHYGNFHAISVQNGPEFAFIKTNPVEPGPLTTAFRLAPVYLAHFDQSDIIRGIATTTLDGVPARCIDFETINGARHETGQVCVHAQEGVLLQARIGDEITKQSRFYAFSNGFLPGHIERWNGEQKIIELDIQTVVRTEYPPNYFDHPPNAVVTHACNSFQPAYPENTPQPAQKSISEDVIDVRVHGKVGYDGRVSDLQVLDGPRRELAEQALQTVSAWTFHPAACDNKPNEMEIDFVVHFKGW